MQHVGIILHLLFSPEVFVYQIIVLADNLEAVLLLLGDIQSLPGDACTLDDETFKQDAEHLFL